LGPAFELADLVCPADDVERLLAGNINQRKVMLGLNDVSRAGGIVTGLSGRVLRNGIEVANTSDVQAVPGELIGIVRHVADMLAAFGETLRAGQVIITGSIVQPLSVEAGEEVEFRLDPIDSVSIRFA
jgi:2-oxo-hept-3-ene-1,7-dioate hydratase